MWSSSSSLLARAVGPLLLAGLAAACLGEQFTSLPNAGGSSGAGQGGGGAGGSGGIGGAGGSGGIGGAGGSGGIGGAGGGGGIGGGGSSGAGGLAGGGGTAGSGGQTSCLPGLPCGSALSDCEATDSLGCQLSCTCADDVLSCSSSCCAEPAVAGLTCTTAGVHCNNACGNACSCDGGVWQCANGPCSDCPAAEQPPANGDACTSSIGTTCTYVQNDGVNECECIANTAAANAWACTLGSGGAGGAGGADGGPGGCVETGSCVGESTTCSVQDGAGCTLSCLCVESVWSCASSCCAVPAVSGKSCGTPGATCRNVCGNACMCDEGLWSCNADCGDCPSDDQPTSGAFCYSDQGTICTVATTSGAATCTCVGMDVALNVWSCL